MNIKIHKYRGCSETEISIKIVTTGNSNRAYFYQNLIKFVYKEDLNFHLLSTEILCTHEDQSFRLHFVDTQYDDDSGIGPLGFLGYIPGAKIGLIIIDLEVLKDLEEITESIYLLKSLVQIPLMILGISSNDSRLLSIESLIELAGELQCYYKEIFRNDEEGYASLIKFIVNIALEFESSIKVQFDYLKYQSAYNDYFS